MDINAALERMRELVAKVAAKDGAESDDELSMAVVFEAIDGWIANGGFLPDAWFGKDRTI